MNKIAVIESSRNNEFRIPIHPSHFPHLSPKRDNLFFQSDYGIRFGQTKETLLAHSFYLEHRDELLKNSDIIFLLKPTKTDLEKMKAGATLIGWCHAVQQIAIAKIAVAKKLTLIAMESMYELVPEGNYYRHLFFENNYITGFEGVAHALSLLSIEYPKNTKIAVITYGNVSQGAVEKLHTLGYNDITVFTRRKVEIIKNKLPDVKYHTLTIHENVLFTKDGISLQEALKGFDIIVNGIMQDPVNPYHFLSTEDLKNIKGKFIIDLSCDDNMGFEFSHETTWEKPVISMHHNYYYAIPNIPSVVWESASKKISRKLLPIINAFLEQRFAPELSQIIEKSTEIKAGKIINQKILQYQKKLDLL